MNEDLVHSPEPIRPVEFRNRLRFYLVSFLVWISVTFVLTGGMDGAGGWLHGWHRWDGDWYIKIWRFGYAADPKLLVFPPGYSLIIGGISWITGSFEISALVVNLLALLAAGILATEFVAERFKISARAFFLFFLSAPVTFYAFSIYSDAVFLFFFWLALIVASRDPRTFSKTQTMGAVALMFVIPWIRLTGYALLAWVVFRRWFAFAVLGALALWLGVNQWISGDPLHFLHMQKVFTMPEGGFLQGFFEAFMTTVRGRPATVEGEDFYFWLQVAVLPLSSMIFLLLTTGWLARRKEYLIALTILAVMVFSRNQAFWRSVFRYDWPLFAFLAIPLLSFQVDSLAGAGERARKIWRICRWILFTVATVLGFALQLIFAWRLHDGAWVF